MAKKCQNSVQQISFYKMLPRGSLTWFRVLLITQPFFVIFTYSLFCELPKTYTFQKKPQKLQKYVCMCS